MFGKILGKKQESSQDDKSKEILQRITKMNLSDMRVYVNNKLNDLEICEIGLREVIKRLISKDEKGNRFIEIDAMDSKIKKAFDLVILVAGNKKITIDTTEGIQEFIELYQDIITKFDTDNKQIYASKLKDALSSSITNLETITQMNKKMRVLGE